MHTLMFFNSYIRFIIVFVTCTMSHICLAQSVDNSITYSYPGIDLMEINTENNEEPPYTPIDAPDGCLGNSVIGNNYVRGNMKLWSNHNLVYNSEGVRYSANDCESVEFEQVENSAYGMKLKVRGNSSAYFGLHHPYKIKLNSRAELLWPGTLNPGHKEWVLLAIYSWNLAVTNGHSDLCSILGECVSRSLGAEWTPRYHFVNLVMNGTYRGCYLLADAVSRGESRIKTEKSGFIIENDAYWWKPGEVWFKTVHLPSYFAYTFKYPDGDSVTDSIKSLYRDYMSTVESSIFDDSIESDDYVDYPSFARWILIHDILGTSDAAGSNMFLYKESMDPASPYLSPLRMGPTWDYDTVFMVDEQHFATIHTNDLFYFPQLFRKPGFVAEYCRQWEAVKNHVCADARACFDELIMLQGEAIDQSLELSHNLYYQQNFALRSQCDELCRFLERRIASLDQLISDPYGTTEVAPVESSQPYNDTYYDISGRKVLHRLPNNLYIQSGAVRCEK